MDMNKVKLEKDHQASERGLVGMIWKMVWGTAKYKVS